MPDRVRRTGQDPVLALLAAAILAAALLLLHWGSRLTFLLDDWEYLLYRPGFTAHSILSPHGEHISIAPVLIYKALLATVGMDSSLPFLAVENAFFLASAALLFVYLRRRVDRFLALLAAVIVLFLGPAYDDLLWIASWSFTGSLACGLGALLLLERGDRRGDVLACVLLSVGVTFGSLGLTFIAAASVDVGLRGERLRRLYVVAVPALLYAVWWAGWGHAADTALSLHNAATTPDFVLDAAAAVFASLFGLVQTGQGVGAGFEWGLPLLLAAVALAAWRLYRMGRVPRELWVALALAGTFWVLAALNEKPGRGPTESRYLLPGAIFVLMIAGELLRGVRVPRPAILIAYLAGAAIVAANVSVLHGAHLAYRNTSELIEADLGAVEIARDSTATPFVLDEDIADTAYVHVISSVYLAAADKYGSPADSAAEIATAPEPARVAADKVLGRALGVSFGPVRTPPPASGPPPQVIVPLGAGAHRHGSCIELRAGSPGAILRLPPGGAIVHASRQAGAIVGLRRFATATFPLSGPPLAAGQVGLARIPTDRATRPWELRLSSPAASTVCGGVNPR
jgi:hypothetical protein